MLRPLSIYIVLVTTLLSASLLRAQTSAGEVNGTVVDRSGGTVASAKVTLTNQATQVASQAQTNPSGYFVFINVRPGSYVLSVGGAGFKTSQVPFQIAVNQTLTQNLTLDVGAVNETVTVTAEAPLLQPSTTNLGMVIAEQAVKQLPLNGRNFT
ncbi:MAG TPA: carboxypeptidase-like regulatory domain-containing protein, partial [Bryobacteraceae bacterium]|nr:carboxypeptidase-like regulatory domain-containing protein [Bryobacteraceae bacterium]